jgi:hypothetical protein
MVPGGINELIWHFAGYLQLTPEVNGVLGVLYDGAGSYAIAADEGLGQGHGRAHERPEHLGSTRLSFAEFAAPSPITGTIDRSANSRIRQRSTSTCQRLRCPSFRSQSYRRRAEGTPTCPCP